MSVISSAVSVPTLTLIASGISLDTGLWTGAALLAISAIRAPVKRSACLTVLVFVAAVLLTSLALVTA